MTDVEFFYRLPVTCVRVTGTRTEISGVDGERTETKATVTTELVADIRTRCPVILSASDLATQKATWNMTRDGRLTGADVSTSVESMAAWGTAFQVGASVASLAAPALISAGPPGWAALVGVAAVGTIGTRVLTLDGVVLDDFGRPGFDSSQTPALPADASPGEWGIHASYVREHEDAANELANLRSCLAKGGQAHAKAVRAAALATTDEDQRYWADRVAHLRTILASASVGAARAETAYSTWIANMKVLTTTNHDHQLEIDLMPCRKELEGWAAGDRDAIPPWASLVNELRIAISVDLEQAVESDHDVEKALEFTPTADSSEVHYRPPRPAVMRVWDAIPTEAESGSTRYTLTLRETQRLHVTCPGNETTISIETGPEATNSVAVAFDDSGALTKVETDIKDPTLQRAADLSSLLNKVDGAVTVGKNLREAFAPPTLVDRAAEAKAAAELGLVPAAEDPLKELKGKLQEQQLRAQLKLAEQMQTATSIPIFVTTSSV